MSAASTPFNGECDFVAAAASLDRIPPESLPEIAFAGRSNVGKSSLINALTGRKALARTSHTPGRTQQLNFFTIQEQFLLVDMPGYGYAKVSKTTRKSWDDLIKQYLRGRVSLKCVFLLIDSRHGLKESDREMMKMLDETAVAYRIILTKADKLKTRFCELHKSGSGKAAGCFLRSPRSWSMIFVFWGGFNLSAFVKMIR